MRKILTAAALLVSSVSSFANYFHPVTNDLVYDPEEVFFSHSCANNEAVQNADGSLNIVYNEFQAGMGTEMNSATCLTRVDVHVPSGWRVQVSSESGVSGLYIGPSAASLEHSVAGTTTTPTAQLYSGEIGGISLTQTLNAIGSSHCGRDMQLTTSANIVALKPDSFINLSGGSLNGTSTRYYFSWTRC